MQKDIKRAAGSPETLLVAVSPGTGPLRGQIISGYAKKKIDFSGEWELLFGIDQWYDSIRFPEPTLKLRSFWSRCHKKKVRKAAAAVDMSCMDKVEEEKSTFLVHIRFRRNATWQGSITWLETGRVQEFRSAFEMLKLMEEACHPGIQESISWEEKKETESREEEEGPV